MYEIKLANGKSLRTDSAVELAIFWETQGIAISQLPAKK